MKCIFNNTTKRGTGIVNAGRVPSINEFTVDLPMPEIGDFINTPDRYQYNNNTFSEVSTWATEKAAADAAKLQTETIANYETAVQEAMDKVAGEWGYGCPPGAPGSIGYAIGAYLNSTNAQWKADAVALQTWLESVWMWANEQQTAILADPTKLPATPEDFVAQMPAAPDKPIT